jgi:CRP-like cAMP-binding protein
MAGVDLIAKLRATRLFEGLSPGSIEHLGAHCTHRQLRAGDRVWRRGDVAQSFITVDDGLVAVQRSTADGENVLVALFGPGETLCVVPALQRISFPADAVVVTDRADILVVAATPVLAALGHDPELTAAVNRALIDHTASLRSKIDIVSAGTVPRRVAALLLHLAGRFGREFEDGTVEIQPKLTREQIGELVNARTETVIRIMSRWSKAGWIRGTSSGIKLMRMDMLRRVAREAVGTNLGGARSALE